MRLLSGLCLGVQLYPCFLSLSSDTQEPAAARSDTTRLLICGHLIFWQAAASCVDLPEAVQSRERSGGVDSI
jgi:hypothetical protein